MKWLLWVVATTGSLWVNAQIDSKASGPPVPNSNFWSTSGNLSTGANYSNLFGTRSWNSPVYFHTARAFTGPGGQKLGIRMKLNGVLTQPIGSYTNINTEGFLGLGWNLDHFWDKQGPFSLLHLNGRSGAFVQSGGYRPWMRTGITFTDNQDLSYMGMRQVGANLDVTETTIAWSDNAGNNVGPDEFAFRHTAGTGESGFSGDLNRADDIDGKMIAQLRPNGDMGLGPVFEAGPSGRKPQSRLHITKSNGDGGAGAALNPKPSDVWAQWSNSLDNGSPLNTGTQLAQRTGHLETDGLRMGVAGRLGLIRHQENWPLIIQSDWDEVSGGTHQGERMRISSSNAPGVPSKPFLSSLYKNNVTRVSISHFGFSGLSQPRALLHLGYNIGSGTGVRDWMEIGTITSVGKNHTYFGHRMEPQQPFGLDAVINWGDTENGQMHVIYTSNNASNGGDFNGLEVAVFSPLTSAYGGLTSPANPNGMLGVGDFSATSGPSHKLHVRGNGRFEHIPDMDSAEYLILGQQPATNPTGIHDNELRKLRFTGNPNDVLLGNGTWGSASGGGGTTVGAHNGASMSTLNPSFVSFGNDWGGTAATLLSHREVPMDVFDVKFSGFTNPGANRFSIGWENVLSNTSKFNVYNRTEEIANLGHSEQVSSAGTVKGTAGVVNEIASEEGIGVWGFAKNVSGNGIGVSGDSWENGNNTGVRGTAGIFNQIENVNTGGLFLGVHGNVQNTGVYANAFSVNGSSTNYGVRALSSGGANCYGIYAQAGGGTSANYAGFFNGDVYATGISATVGNVLVSDKKFKTNIEDVSNAMELINQLKIKKYDFKVNEYEMLGFSDKTQLGVIAQEVASILPDAVVNGVIPEQYDFEGNKISESIEYMGVRYQQFIPLLLAGVKEQHAYINELENTIQTLDERLARLENMLSGEQRGRQQKSNGSTQEQVVLANFESIRLDQNVPNPFVENTLIEYDIPEHVTQAAVYFYDLKGNLLKMVELKNRGVGQLKVFGKDIMAGVYTYTLVTDGELVISKKMIKAAE